MNETTLAELYSIYKEHTAITTDTRKIVKNGLFFALKGDNFDGNAFAEKALALGAAYAVVDDPQLAKTNDAFLYVTNVLASLQNLARHHREKLTIPIIGLTGSNGKTTTKELIYSVLSQKYKAAFTQGNLNNHIGVPLTLLSIDPTHEIAIVEMGANHQKEIEFLCTISQPNWGYITNFGKAHLEGFGGVEGVIKGKSELYAYLRSAGQKALVNANDLLQVEKSEGIERSLFGGDTGNKVSLLPAQQGQLQMQWKGHSIQSQLTGDYNFTNACCAIAFGELFGVDDLAIVRGISEYTPENNRSQILKQNGQTLIMDAYNANPTSMEAALRNFVTFEGPRLAVLGDMLELGDESQSEHEYIVNLTKDLGIESVLFVGKEFKLCVSDKEMGYASVAAVKEKFNAMRNAYASILIKGSRGIQLEKLVE